MLGIVHACPNDAELKLTDAALHTQQQTIVRPARIVNAVRIDDFGANEPAELEQVMPVASVTRESRSVQAQHGSDFAGANLSDQPFESGSHHTATGGAPKIIVDDLDAAKSMTACQLD